MSSRHRRTLEAVFRDPVSATIVWDDVERMLVHHGARVVERSGSRISVTLNGIDSRFHRPHPQKEAKRYQVLEARALLTQAGIVP
jgi:hypothetical protein